MLQSTNWDLFTNSKHIRIEKYPKCKSMLMGLSLPKYAHESSICMLMRLSSAQTTLGQTAPRLFISLHPWLHSPTGRPHPSSPAHCQPLVGPLRPASQAQIHSAIPLLSPASKDYHGKLVFRAAPQTGSFDFFRHWGSYKVQHIITRWYKKKKEVQTPLRSQECPLSFLKGHGGDGVLPGM